MQIQERISLLSYTDLVPEPLVRNLRIFTFDPGISAQYDTAGISEITIPVRWEAGLTEGPVGDYIEVVDADPTSGVFYKPVDLNDPRILAQNGLPPSETNPQFHQQMVYAVAMTTITHFEQALGRVALWASHRETDPDGRYLELFVRRLRIYPHALRDRNAFYSPGKKALLFGYFPVGVKDRNNTPGTLVFTCLSHDIIAHEITHALLDGVHPRFSEPVNPDVLAFHEAFADLVALFQHFSYAGVLRDQIARTRGNLGAENLLGQLAQQFGKASGRGKALRDALGSVSETTGKWEPLQPNVRALDEFHEPHDRGAILVAAVFGAFTKVYRSRTADLFRIASEGTGVLREGDIHPDLSNRLAAEAARTALSILQMCIRAIDYCPPVGITFGDYLRAIITADVDYNPEDTAGVRLAFLDCFRQWGIHPPGMRSMSVDALLWPTGEDAREQALGMPMGVPSMAPEKENIRGLFTEEQPIELSQGAPRGRSNRPIQNRLQSWTLESGRYETWEGVESNSMVLWGWLMRGKGQKLRESFGLVVNSLDAPPSVYRSEDKNVAVEVHSVRTALRRSVRGSVLTDLVVEITQRRRGYYDREKQSEVDREKQSEVDDGMIKLDEPDFIYRAGCTILINSLTMEVRRVIRTPGTISDNRELERMRRYLVEGGLSPANAFDRAGQRFSEAEPFALLHRHEEH